MSYTMEEKWKIIEPMLNKLGVDTVKILPLQRASVVGQAESDDMIGQDESEWRDWIEWLIDQHPTWAGEGYWRFKNASSLLNNWEMNPFDDPGSVLTPDELAENRYGVISWYDGNSRVVAGGDSIKDVLGVVLMLHYESETPEHVEFFVDLDNGEMHDISRGQLGVVITLTLDGEELTAAYGSANKEEKV